MFEIRELVTKEELIERELEKSLSGLEVIEDLMTLEKYKDSTTMIEKRNKLSSRINNLLMEYRIIVDTINTLQDIIDDVLSEGLELEEEETYVAVEVHPELLAWIESLNK